MSDRQTNSRIHLSVHRSLRTDEKYLDRSGEILASLCWGCSKETVIREIFSDIV